jgi:hypothetical protein
MLVRVKTPCGLKGPVELLLLLLLVAAMNK